MRNVVILVARVSTMAICVNPPKGQSIAMVFSNIESKKGILALLLMNSRELRFMKASHDTKRAVAHDDIKDATQRSQPSHYDSYTTLVVAYNPSSLIRSRYMLLYCASSCCIVPDQNLSSLRIARLQLQHLLFFGSFGRNSCTRVMKRNQIYQ
jgi:hypothetical protein